MDGKRSKTDSNFVLNHCAKRLHDDGVDRISALPDEIIVVILSFLSMREAASTSVLSSRWLDLWKHTPNPKSDRISRLPHSIIVHILSFLPVKEAVTTSVLCSRWPDLWKHSTNLDFATNMPKLDIYEMYEMQRRGSLDVERCKYVQLVNSVTKSHKAPSLKQFSIYFYVNQSAKCIVAKWIEFAFSRGVKRLVLDFGCWDRMNMVVLEELLRESGLCSSPQALILFKSLKTLYLGHVNVSGEAVKIFLCNCPLLEDLIIDFSFVTSDVEVCGATLVLKYLSMYGCSGEKSLRVSAPNLTRLDFSNTLGKLFLESVPKLVDAVFEFDSHHIDVVQNVASALFRFGSQLEVLNLSLKWPKVFFANEFAEMPKLRKLDVRYYVVKNTQSLMPVTALLWASPRLQEFRLHFTDIENGDAPIQVGRNGEGYPHLDLKLFVLEGLVDGAVGCIELLSYILDHCIGLEKIEIIIGSPQFYEMGVPSGPSAIKNHNQAARSYVEQHLQGKLPRHIKLQFFDFVDSRIK